MQAYSGLLPAVLGSVPSSMMYFGAYETAKLYLRYSMSCHLHTILDRCTPPEILSSQPSDY